MAALSGSLLGGRGSGAGANPSEATATTSARLDTTRRAMIGAPSGGRTPGPRRRFYRVRPVGDNAGAGPSLAHRSIRTPHSRQTLVFSFISRPIQNNGRQPTD